MNIVALLNKKAKGILEIEQDSIQDSTQDFQDSNSFYPYHSSYPHLASKDKNMGVKEIGEEERESQKEKYYIDKEGYLQGLDIIKYPITRLEFSLTNSFKPKAIVLHRTNSSTAKSTLESWSNPNSARVGTIFLLIQMAQSINVLVCINIHSISEISRRKI